MATIQDNADWYGFSSSLNSGFQLLSFGQSLSNTPTVTQQGFFGSSLFNKPRDLRFVKEGAVWYCVVANSGGGNLLKLKFNNGLTSNPEIEVVPNSSGMQQPNGLSQIKDGNDIWFVATNFNSQSITLFNFGSSMSNIPVARSINTGYSGIFDISIKKVNNKWIGWSTVYAANKLIRLDFGSSLMNDPTITEVAGINGLVTPLSIELIEDQEEIMGLVSCENGNLIMLNLGVTSEYDYSKNLSNLGTLNNTSALTLDSFSDGYIVHTIDYSSGRLHRLTFNNCSQPNPFSTEFEPKTINYPEAGTYQITLLGFNLSGGNIKRTAIQVLANQSIILPIIDNGNKCVNSDVITSVNQNPSINSYEWRLNGSLISTMNQASQTFGTSGEYVFNLKINLANGCTNQFQKTIKIYNPPNPSFILPSGLICTNNQFNFINGTTDNFDGNLTYEWLLNDQLIATTRDLQYAFSTTGNQTIKLKTAIPGCTTESSQVISSVQAGPTVGFSVSGRCQDESISFTNSSSGAIAGFAWNLGNGESVTQTNPSKVYSTPGDYTVTLESQGTNGCVSKTSKIVTIYSKPQTDFSIDLPPFSCAGTPSQFKDLTPSLSDSNIASWQWNFGDVTDNTATSKNPTHIYATAGTYSVSLQTTTNFGCSNTIQKSISILPSPVASFTNGLACLNQNLQFVNSSSGIKSSLWTINNQQFSTLNPPIQRFTNPGSYEIRLTITGSNDCQNTTTKVIQIKSPPLVDFSVDAPCTGNPTQFTNVSTGGNDALSAIQWDLGGNQLTGTRVNFTFVDPRIYGIRMNYLGQSGCTYPVTKNVSIVEGPVAKFTASDEVGAAPLVVNFTNTSAPTNLQWEWNFKKGNATLFTTPFKNPTFNFTELGEYTASLKATNSLSCVSEYVIPIQVVIPQIRASLTDFKLVDAGNGAKQALFIFENKSNVSISDPEIVMDVSGGPLLKEKIVGKFKPGEKVTSSLNATLLPRSLVYACAELFVKDDPQRDDDRKCLSLQDEPVLFAPYPNPVASEFRFEWISSTLDQAQVVVYNSSGQLVFSQEWSLIQIGLNQITISASEANLGDGLFYFTFQQGSLKKTFRFMVAKE